MILLALTEDQIVEVTEDAVLTKHEPVTADDLIIIERVIRCVAGGTLDRDLHHAYVRSCRNFGLLDDDDGE